MLLSFIAMFAGAFLVLSFAPVGVYAFAFVSPAVLCYLWMRSTAKQAFTRGFYFGFGFFLAGISWIFISIHNFGNASTWLAALITLLFVCFMSLFFATQGYVFRYVFQNKSERIQCLFAFPALWLIWEWLRSVIFTGLPWLLLGYSQTSSPLHGLAPTIGTYGMTLCTVLIAGAIALMNRYTTLKDKFISLGIILVIIVAAWILNNKEWTQPKTEPIQVSLIQGNFDQFLKWDSKTLTTILDTYKDLSEQHTDSQIIVWPEAAIPYYPSQLNHYVDAINTLGKDNDITFIVGAPTFVRDKKQYYNSLLMYGKYQGQYNKQHLVPFGEYTPWNKLVTPLMRSFSIPMSNFTSGDKTQAPLVAGQVTIAPFICYEIIFPQEVLKNVKDTQLIVVINDDAWFGNSLALSQHLQMAQMAALQTNRYVLFCSNTGITAIIDPQGKIIKSAPINQQAVITADVTPMTGNTPFMRWGYYPTFTVTGLLLLVALLL